MSKASEIADQINRAIPAIKVGALCVYGDFFGRPYDAFLQAKSAHASPDGDRLIVEFDGGETLEVWNPKSASISQTVFAIAYANRVRWTWFYYGRPRLPENQYFQEHVRSGDDVSVATDVDWAPIVFNPSVNRPAVEIL